jgi:hypothetical protein
MIPLCSFPVGLSFWRICVCCCGLLAIRYRTPLSRGYCGIDVHPSKGKVMCRSAPNCTREPTSASFYSNDLTCAYRNLERCHTLSRPRHSTSLSPRSQVSVLPIMYVFSCATVIYFFGISMVMFAILAMQITQLWRIQIKWKIKSVLVLRIYAPKQQSR